MGFKILNTLLERFAGSKKYVYNPDTTSCRECCSTNACNRNGCGSQGNQLLPITKKMFTEKIIK